MSNKRNKIWIAWMLVAPVLILRGFTTIYPIFTTFKNSFFDMSLLRGGEAKFIGTQNFIQMFTDEKLATSIEFTAIFTIASMILHVVLGVGLALMLNIKFRGRKFLRTIVLIPWAMPMVVAGLAARWAFNDTYGLINDLVRRILPDFHYDWLINELSARVAVISVDLWKDVPFFAILVLAALQFIPSDLYEAAKIDGAGIIKSFFSITLPGIKNTVLTLCIFFTMWRLTSFDVVYSMTSGGPGDSTTLLSYRIMTEAFTNLNLGYASSLAVVLFATMVVLTLIDVKYIKKINK
ncbi:carbohydrate ABC transporter permease [Clostridium beijerinckii]|uniref:Multiple sugar transport system permease protein n=1 Tax=Clostridium beijerinckii TaxID=1520 RepID=A0AAX0ATM3_CLOBE|nr:sugar ABC transporter permease [Clostridium beijerinckii]MBA8933929.1 multiple sugar transport system permease protein [Clostridium beijerinckii]NRT86425.1 multiple sugar transport system permease protein [Clostridium beijerinckii]NRU38123.1 multiple sugar transport system permease protein [Clostridium beijerinckii]NSA98598.1 multiple sugar transport system permease protein [Clostridium beijerinckii]NYC71857.1 multiple sugar transport system permease protein [Clostridium beijerinckii]